MISIQELYEIFKLYPQVSTDTRNLKQDSIFFALKGANFNGNAFASKAIEGGCKYAVVDEEAFAKEPNIILVHDVLKTLQDLATYHRDQLDIPVLAITGSNGKTTTKELVYAVLKKKYNVYATIGNLNNHIGVPLTLLSLTKDHDFAVVEMGANHQGEINMLCEIAQPNYGMITNIGKAHLEGFGGVQGVIKGKSEMYRFLKSKEREVIVNADNDLLMDLSASIQRFTYGTKGNANVQGGLLTSEPFLTFTFISERGNEIEVKTNLIGSYNIENALSAVAVGKRFSVDDSKIKEAIENYAPTNNRSQLVKKGTNTLILDAYNANPTSMHAAIINFAKIQAADKILVIGEMLELGTESKVEHQKIVDLIQTLPIKKALLIGSHFNGYADGKKLEYYPDVKAAATFFSSNQFSDTTFLIKGSRGVKLEYLLEYL